MADDKKKLEEQEINTVNYFISTLSKQPRLIVDIKRIKKIEAIYKNNFLKAKTFTDLQSKFLDYDEDLKKSPAAFSEIKKQYEKKLGLQPCILTECYMAQTIANILNLKNFEDVDAGGNIPTKIGQTIFRVKNSKAGSSFRYIYFNDKADIVLAQCGDSSTIDAVFVKERIAIRIEFKEEDSKANEADIPKYDENGKLITTKTFEKKYPYYVPFVEIFNKKTDVFTMMGHNFNIVDYLDEKNTNRVIDGIISAKFIDLYVFQKGDFLVPLAANNLYDNVKFNGSEIRTAGRNNKKLWSVELAKSEITKQGGKIEDGLVSLPLNEKMYSIGRGKNIVTRYKINPLIYVPIEKTAVLKNGDISFNFSDLKQLKPTISLHLSPL